MFRRAKVINEVKCQHVENGVHIIDTSCVKSRGTINLYTPTLCHFEVRACLEKQVDAIREEFVSEQYEVGIAVNVDGIHLILRKGGSIQHVLMPEEYRTIVLKGPLNEPWVDDHLMKAKSCGKITLDTSTKDFASYKLLYVTFADPADAAKAVNLDVNNITVEPSRRETRVQATTTLKVEWSRRKERTLQLHVLSLPSS